MRRDQVERVLAHANRVVEEFYAGGGNWDTTTLKVRRCMGLRDFEHILRSNPQEAVRQALAAKATCDRENQKAVKAGRSPIFASQTRRWDWQARAAGTF